MVHFLQGSENLKTIRSAILWGGYGQLERIPLVHYLPWWNWIMQGSRYLSLSIALPQHCRPEYNAVIWQRNAKIFQNLFTQDLNAFNSERCAKKTTPENGLRMGHLAPPTGGDTSPVSSPHWPVASAMATLVSLTSSFHMQQRCYFFLARTLLWWGQII